MDLLDFKTVSIYGGPVGLLYRLNRVGLMDYYAESIGWVCWNIFNKVASIYNIFYHMQKRLVHFIQNETT